MTAALETSPPAAIQLTVILPANHEADNLRELLPQLSTVLGSLLSDRAAWEVLVIDTPTPTDDTAAVCAAHGARHIARQTDDCYGAAIRTGVEESRGEFVIIMDADGSHPPPLIAQLWPERLQADIVIASRYVPGGSTDNPWLLVVMSRFLNFAFRTVARIPVHDLSGSYRLYRGGPLRALRLDSRHFEIGQEILVKLMRRPAGQRPRVKEVPFAFHRRAHGKSKRNLIVFIFKFAVALIRWSRTRNA
jgi:dolichol-phosphate mannosyltransferase